MPNAPTDYSVRPAPWNRCDRCGVRVAVIVASTPDLHGFVQAQELCERCAVALARESASDG